MAVINEARYKIRRGFIVLLSLWFGNKKPPRKPFMEIPLLELKRLQLDGFTVNGKQYYVVVLIITTDTVARTIPWNVAQFNGKYGCNFCLMEGLRVKKGKGSVRVYPEPAENEPAVEQRSLQQHERDLKSIRQSKKEINGIKGETPLSILPNFDYVKACVPEYMHGSCLGVVKYFLKLFFTGKKGQGSWFIGTRTKLSIVNARLKKTKPPYEITRTGGQVDDLPNWKASMFRSFGLYYFVVLEGILPPKYFNHFCLLSYGLNVLLQEKVSVEDVRKTEIIFKQFVRETEVLYGIEHVTANIHFLTHLSECVMNWGCLWSYSTFIPEWFNGELLNLKHGSQSVSEQMAESYLLKMAIRDKVVRLEKCGQTFPPDVSKLLRELLHLPILTNDDGPDITLHMEQFSLISPVSEKSLCIEEEIALINHLKILPEAIDSIQFQSYSRIKIHSTCTFFTTTEYNRSPKRINYCCLISSGSFLFIESILRVKNSPDEVYLIGREIGTDSKQSYIPDKIGETSFSYLIGQTMKCVGLSNSLIAFNPVDIVTKCVIALYNDVTQMYVVTALVSNFETD